MLMKVSSDALRNMHYKELSLTVTADNHAAVALYEKLGFSTIKLFTAGVWPQ
jgi:ribosomal protein S18 acetylase RimI-like enzyme